MINEIKKVLEKDRNISLVYLYGSVAKGQARPGSDIDIAVMLEKKSHLSPYFESRLALKIEKKLKTKMPVEVRLLNGANLRFANQVLRYGKLIHARNRMDAIRFETITRDRYFDFRPFMLEYDRLREQRMGIA